jgi:hypothetical protein
VEVWTQLRFDQDGYELSEKRHLVDPYPRRSPVHGAQVDGQPVMIRLDGREIAVREVLATYAVRELGERDRAGTAWRLSLADYRRVVMIHTEEGWFLAR